MRLTTFFALFLSFFSLKTAAQKTAHEWIVRPVLTGFDEFLYLENDLGLYQCSKGNQHGVINSEGKIIVPLEYKRLIIHPKGFIDLYTFDEPELHFVAIPSGKIVHKMGLESFKVEASGFIVHKKNGKFGAMDVFEKTVMPFEFEKYEWDYKINRFVFTKANGERALLESPPQYVPKSTREFNERHAREKWPGRIIFEDYKTKKSGFLRMNGDTVARAMYTEVFYHKKGVALACTEKGKCALIDQENKALTPFEYESNGRPQPDKFHALIAKKAGRSGALRVQDGSVVVPFEYDDVFWLDQTEGFIVKKGGKHGLLDRDGKQLFPIEYDEIDDDKKWAVRFAKDKKHGYWIPQTNQFVQPKYDGFRNNEDSILIVKRDSLYFLMDAKTERELCPAEHPGLYKNKDLFVGERYPPGKRMMRNPIMFSVLRRDGTTILPYDSVRVAVFDNSSFLVQRKNGEVDHLDRDGKTLRHFAKNTAWGAAGIYIWIEEGGKKKYFHHADPVGQEEWIEGVSDPAENLRLTKKNGLHGYTDANGKWVIQPEFESAESSRQGGLKVKLQGKWGVLKNPVADKK